MTLQELQRVVLTRDVPEHGLQRGDMGTIVALYQPDGVEVEFVRFSGETQALLTLTVRDIRAAQADELPAARTLRRSA